VHVRYERHNLKITIYDFFLTIYLYDTAANKYFHFWVQYPFNLKETTAFSAVKMF